MWPLCTNRRVFQYPAVSPTARWHPIDYLHSGTFPIPTEPSGSLQNLAPKLRGRVFIVASCDFVTGVFWTSILPWFWNRAWATWLLKNLDWCESLGAFLVFLGLLNFLCVTHAVVGHLPLPRRTCLFESGLPPIGGLCLLLMSGHSRLLSMHYVWIRRTSRRSFSVTLLVSLAGKSSKYLSKTFQYSQSILLYPWNLSQPSSNLPHPSTYLSETFQYNSGTLQNPIRPGIPAYPNPLQNLYGF